MRSWSALGAFVVLGAATAVIARTRRAPSDGHTTPALRAVAASSGVPASSAAAPSAAGPPRKEQIVLARLVDLLADAVVDVPPIDKESSLNNHWRRSPGQFTGLSPQRARLVQQIGFVPKPMPGEAMGHGMAFGDDDAGVSRVYQRESIVAPPPSSLRFRITLPQGAAFQTEIGALGALGPITFQVSVTSGAERKVVLTEVIDATRSQQWLPLSVDLSHWAGKSVELELSTSAHVSPGWRPAAMWGTPVIVGPGDGQGLNLIWISIDALRADALASWHDPARDALAAAAKLAPLDAWLPRMPEIAPELDRLAAQSVLFTHAYSAATWSRPGTVAMLTGCFNVDLGLSAYPWMPTEDERRHFYGASPPLLPLLLRPAGYTARAIVNNFYMVGHAKLGLDMGFDSLDDHRHKLLDTQQITDEAIAFLQTHRKRRFALYFHYNSPHSPYSPPEDLLDRVPAPPRGPHDRVVRLYLAEISKDSRAVGQLLAEVDRLGLGDHTLIVVTADHAETLSVAHDGPVMMDGHPMQMRFHHAPAMWEETTRIPMLLRLPGRLPVGKRIDAAVQHTDLLPTFLELAGVPVDPRITGRSLLPLIEGKPEPEHMVLVEGRGIRAVQDGRYRYIERDAASRIQSGIGRGWVTDSELYDLQTDPGERSNLHEREPAIASRLHRALDARMAEGQRRSKLLAPADAAQGSVESGRASLRFVGGPSPRRVSGVVRLSGDAQAVAGVVVTPLGVDAKTVSRVPGGLQLDFATDPARSVGVALVLPSGVDVTWELSLDGAPWPADKVFVGPFGFARADAVHGITTPDAVALAAGPREANVSPKSDVGMFVLLDRGEAEVDTSLPTVGGAAQETMQLLKDWGYANESH